MTSALIAVTGVALALNLIDVVADPGGGAWDGIRYAVGVVWLVLVACVLVLWLLERRRAS